MALASLAGTDEAGGGATGSASRGFLLALGWTRNLSRLVCFSNVRLAVDQFEDDNDDLLVDLLFCDALVDGIVDFRIGLMAAIGGVAAISCW